MTRSLLLTLAVLAACALPAHAAPPGPPDGLAADVRAVSAILPVRTDNGPRALDVYRALLPEGLTLPAEPAVGVWLAQLSSLRSASGRPMDPATNWIEGAIQLRANHDGVEGWYPLHYPVTAEFWFHAGRYVGLPKRHASAAIVPDGTGYKATAVPAGTGDDPSMTLGFQPNPGVDAGAVQRAFSVPSDPFLVLNSPLRGPDLMRVQYGLNQPYPFQSLIPGGAPPFAPDSAPDAGDVKVALATDLDAVQEPDLPKLFPAGTSLADVVVPEQTVAGSHAFYALTVSSVSERIGEGGYAERPPQSTPPEGPVGTPTCGRRRILRFRVRRHPGVRVLGVSATAGGRRVPARMVGRDRVRVVLRGRARSARTVTVTVRQARGLSQRVTRAVRAARC